MSAAPASIGCVRLSTASACAHIAGNSSGWQCHGPRVALRGVLLLAVVAAALVLAKAKAKAKAAKGTKGNDKSGGASAETQCELAGAGAVADAGEGQADAKRVVATELLPSAEIRP